MLFGNTETLGITEIRKRLLILSVLVLISMGVLFIRLWQLQISQSEKYRTLSESNRIRVLPVKSPRGYITARNGALLVENRPEFKLYLIPEEVPDVEELLSRMENNISMDMELVKELLASSKKFKPVLVKDDLGRNELAFLEEHRPDLPGTFIQVEPVRFYRYGPLAAHLLGYLGEISEKELKNRARDRYMLGDYMGKSGLEKAYDRELRGLKGRKFMEVDALGRELRPLGDIEPTIGNIVTLTLDLDLQILAEDLLHEERGAILVMDPRDGQILAYVSKPAFDPNLFASGLRKEDWEGLSNDKTHPLQDRVMQGQYPPGSVFKIITAVAALEEEIINEETSVYCPGHYYFGKRIYRDWKRSGHGVVNLHRALVESCDVYFYQVGEKVGVDTLHKYAKGFGLGKALDIALGRGQPGLIPSSTWKTEERNEPWFPGETLITAIGQGYVLVTPMQLAVMISAIANGGTLYLPQFVERVENQEGRIIKRFKPQELGTIPATPATLAIIRKALWGVVNDPEGTGKGARLPWVEVAGKTGTAQVVRQKTWNRNQTDTQKELLDHAWFVSFAPLEEPSIAMVILIENAGKGGSRYAHIAKKIIKAYLSKQTKTGVNETSSR